MKLIDAYWELKNSGVKTCEVVFNTTDEYSSSLKDEIEKQFDFSVVKIPVGSLDLIHILEEDGYRYLENQMMIEFEVSQAADIYSEWYSRLDGFNCTRISDSDSFNLLMNEVRSDLFQADRFSLDPYWPAEVASCRYANWIDSMYTEGTTDFYLLQKGHEPAGFFSLKKESVLSGSCPIAGIFNKHRKHGFFLALVYQWLKISAELGYKKLSTSISTNNIPIHSFLSRIFFFKIEATYVVLRKVING